MTVSHIALDRPLTLPNGAVLKDRFAKSAMSESLGTPDNRMTGRLPRLFARWAAGGTGLLITGNVMVDRRHLGEPNNVALEDDRDMPLLRAWSQAGTANGTHLWMQLNHPGRQVIKFIDRDPVAPPEFRQGTARDIAATDQSQADHICLSPAALL